MRERSRLATLVSLPHRAAALAAFHGFEPLAFNIVPPLALVGASRLMAKNAVDVESGALVAPLRLSNFSDTQQCWFTHSLIL